MRRVRPSGIDDDRCSDGRAVRQAHPRDATAFAHDLGDRRTEPEHGVARVLRRTLQVLRRQVGRRDEAAHGEVHAAIETRSRLTKALVVESTRRGEAAVVESHARQLIRRPLLVRQPDAVVGGHHAAQKRLRGGRAQNEAAAAPEVGELCLRHRRADVLRPALVVCETFPCKLHGIGDRVHHAADA